MPQIPAEWDEVAHEYWARWNFPNCIGALDGKHIAIIEPLDAGSHYYNYKRFHSIVLLALVNANYEFIFVDVGVNGRISDGGVLNHSKLGQDLAKGKLNLPNPKNLPGSDKIVPYGIVGDEAFGLHTNLWKPFAQKNLTKAQRIFNYRLSRARRVSENVFGIISNKFRVFQTPMHLSPKKATIVTLAACYLHNFLRKRRAPSYSPSFDLKLDLNGQDINSLTRLSPTQNRNASGDAKQIRETLMNFFMDEGAVPWQWDKI